MTTRTSTDREQQLAEILLGYLDAVEAGQLPDRRELMAAHPDFAEDLEDFFAGRDRLERFTAPKRRSRPLGLSSDITKLAPRPGQAGASVSPPMGPEPGALGDFQLLREVGRGGMGIVYEARQISLDRRVALKVLPFAAALDPKHLQRFKNEAQAAAQLHHSNIVPVYAVGCERSVHYYAMQFIEGQSLAAMIDELRESDGAGPFRGARTGPDDRDATASYVPEVQANGPAPATVDAPVGEDTPVQTVGTRSTEHSHKDRQFFRRVAEIGVKAAHALEHAHQLGVVHRDIKPANLMLDVRGNLWVTDFGLALFKSDSGLTMTGELLGTLRYMSPEQTFAKRGLVDHRADIYSLGATLYELMTLEHVFSGQDRQELLHQIAYDEPRAPRSIDRTIPVELETVVLKALAKNPADRYATCQELADDLERYLEDKPIMARRPTLLEKAKKWSRRHRSWVYAGVAAMFMAFAAMAVITYVIFCEERQVRLARDRAQQNAWKATKERDRAERISQDARKAVEELTKLAMADLKRPGLESIRKKFLESALAYYEKLKAQQGDDPTLRAELAASALDVARILAELGEPGHAMVWLEEMREAQEERLRRDPNNSKVREKLDKIKYYECYLAAGPQVALLFDCRVQKALGLCPTQLGNIEAHTSDLGTRELMACQESAKLSKDEQMQRFRVMVERNQKAVLANLTTNQLGALHQIALRKWGVYAFCDPDVIRALELTPNQQQRIEKILHRESDGLRCEVHYADGQLTVEGESGWPCRECLNKVLAILTPKQQARWREMVGEFRTEDGPA